MTTPNTLENILAQAIQAGDDAVANPNAITPSINGEETPKKDFMPNALNYGVDLQKLPLVEAIDFGNQLAGVATNLRRGIDNLFNGLLNNLADVSEPIKKDAAKLASILSLIPSERDDLVKINPLAIGTRQVLNTRLQKLLAVVSKDLPEMLQPAVAPIMFDLLKGMINGDITVKEASDIHIYDASVNVQAIKRLDNALVASRQELRRICSEIVEQLQESSYEKVELDQDLQLFSNELKTTAREQHPYSTKLEELGIQPGFLDPTVESFLQKLNSEEFTLVTNQLLREATGKDNIETILVDLEQLLVEYGQYQTVVSRVENDVNDIHTQIAEISKVAEGMLEGKTPETELEHEISSLIQGTQLLNTKITEDLTAPNVIRLLNENNPKTTADARLERFELLTTLPKGTIDTAFLPINTSVIRDKRDPHEVFIAEITGSLQSRYPEKMDDQRLQISQASLLHIEKQVSKLSKELNAFETKNPESTQDATTSHLLSSMQELIERSLVPYEKAKGNSIVFEFIAADAVTNNGLPNFERNVVSFLIRDSKHPLSQEMRKKAAGLMIEWNDAIGNRNSFEINMDDHQKGEFSQSVSKMQKTRTRFQDILARRKNNLEELSKAVTAQDPDHIGRTVHYRKTRQGDALQNAIEHSENIRANAIENRQRINRVDAILGHNTSSELREIAGADPDKREQFGKEVQKRMQEEIKNSTKRYEQDVNGFAEAFQLQRIGTLMQDNKYDLGTLVARLEDFRMSYRKTQNDLDDQAQVAESEVAFLTSLQIGKISQVSADSKIDKDNFNSLGRSLNRAFQNLEMETASKTPVMSQTQVLETLQAATLSRDIEKAANKVVKMAGHVLGKNAKNKIPEPSTLVRVAAALALHAVTNKKSNRLKGSTALFESMPKVVGETLRRYMRHRNDINMNQMLTIPRTKPVEQKKNEI